MLRQGQGAAGAAYRRLPGAGLPIHLRAGLLAQSVHPQAGDLREPVRVGHCKCDAAAQGRLQVTEASCGFGAPCDIARAVASALKHRETRAKREHRASDHRARSLNRCFDALSPLDNCANISLGVPVHADPGGAHMLSLRTNLSCLAVLAGIAAVSIAAGGGSALAAKGCAGGPACGAKADGAKVAHLGTCVIFCQGFAATLMTQPLCGTDPLNHARMTYPNNCAAENARAIWIHSGPCK